MLDGPVPRRTAYRRMRQGFHGDRRHQRSRVGSSIRFANFLSAR
ncbi:hypothetical protein C7S17_2502 [Burkholderia thailandensis]|nr:hypothetical protein [Burkholderia thailandensis]